MNAAEMLGLVALAVLVVVFGGLALGAFLDFDPEDDHEEIEP